MASSVPKQVRNLHEYLPPIVEKTTLRSQEVSIRVKLKRAIQVLQVAVVPYIYRRTRVQKISQQNVRIETLDAL